MKVDTKTLKKAVGKKVRYKVKGSNLWSIDSVIEILRKNIIFSHDARHFTEIKEIELIENL